MFATSTTAAVWYRRLAGEATPWTGGRSMFAFRCWAVVWHTVTLCILRRLLDVRTIPPMLPTSDALPQFDLFWPLLATLWLIPLVARTGLILHTVLFLYALATDEIRVQPELMSPVILLWGTLAGTVTRDVARLHLGAMWFYAGFHKLLAPRYWTQLGPYIMNGLWEMGAGEEVATTLSVMLALSEMAIAIAVFVPRTRKIAALGTLIMHAIIVIGVTKTPTVLRLIFTGEAEQASAMFERGEIMNGPIWAWNLILLPAGMTFFWAWKETPAAAWRRSSRTMRVVALTFLLSPLAYYLGWMNPYLAHCLFSGNTIKASYRTVAQRIKDQAGKEDTYKSYRDLGEDLHLQLRMPMPSAERNYLRYFDKIAQRGDELIIDYPAAMAYFTGKSKLNVEHGGGVWIDDKEHGLWTFYRPDGTHFEIRFKNGEVVK